MGSCIHLADYVIKDGYQHCCWASVQWLACLSRPTVSLVCPINFNMPSVSERENTLYHQPKSRGCFTGGPNRARSPVKLYRVPQSLSNGLNWQSVSNFPWRVKGESWNDVVWMPAKFYWRSRDPDTRSMPHLSFASNVCNWTATENISQNLEELTGMNSL